MAKDCHNTPGLPNQTPVLTAPVWNELHDLLTLAQDALGDAPRDFTRDYLRNAIMHTRPALRILHGALERLEGMGK